MMSNLKANLRRNLKEIREERGLSQNQLRIKTGVDIWGVENNKRTNVSLDTITKLADALEVHPQDLLDDEE